MITIPEPPFEPLVTPALFPSKFVDAPPPPPPPLFVAPAVDAPAELGAEGPPLPPTLEPPEPPE